MSLINSYFKILSTLKILVPYQLILKSEGVKLLHTLSTLFFSPPTGICVHSCNSKRPEDEGVNKEILETRSGFFNCQIALMVQRHLIWNNYTLKYIALLTKKQCLSSMKKLQKRYYKPNKLFQQWCIIKIKL